MAYREVTMVEVKEVLRLWLRGRPKKAIVRRTQVSRNTVRGQRPEPRCRCHPTCLTAMTAGFAEAAGVRHRWAISRTLRVVTHSAPQRRRCPAQVSGAGVPAQVSPDFPRSAGVQRRCHPTCLTAMTAGFAEAAGVRHPWAISRTRHVVTPPTVSADLRLAELRLRYGRA